MSTEAGKALLNRVLHRGSGAYGNPPWEVHVARVEAEARRAALTALRAEVEGLRDNWGAPDTEGWVAEVTDAVLAAIDRALA